MFPAEGYDLSKITVYSLDVSNASEAEWEEMWEKLYDESFAAQLPGWLDVYKRQNVYWRQEVRLSIFI